MASYQDTLLEIFSLKAVKTTEKHEAVRRVCERLGNPQLAYKVIHITGTCGKGTVTMQTAQVLHKSGHKVGMVISPHLLDFRERITVNFEKIPEEYVLEKYSELKKLFVEEGFEYSFEQIVCVLGFMYLRDCEVEFGVIEVGCGGKRDASNIVDPVVSVITSVGLDHMHLLGNTVEEIAIEKSGVIKENRPCVLGPNTPQSLLHQIASSKNSPVLQVDPPPPNLTILQENSKITEKIFTLIPVSPSALAQGLLTSQPFRFQEIKAFSKTFLIDVGHNSMSLDRVLLDARRIYGPSIRVVLAVSKGKYPAEFLSIIKNYTNLIHLTTTSHMRLVSVAELQTVCESLGVVPLESGPIDKLIEVVKDLEDDVTVIIGSCFLVEDLVQAFRAHSVFL